VIRPTIAEAGALVSAKDAFRRVLALANPGFGGAIRATHTLYAGLQLVLPGEYAPCHRHSQTAIRFVIEGTGALTTVDGEPTTIAPGDCVVTPHWSWHDHRNDGDMPVVWLDVLDTPLIDALDTVFRESYSQELHPTIRPNGDSGARYGAGLRPLGDIPATGTTQILNYNAATALAAVRALARAGCPDPVHGHKMRYANPATGADPTPTMAAFLQFLPAGFTGNDYRTSDGAIYCVAKGRGTTVIEGARLDWAERDVFVVPGWHVHRHEISGPDDAVLFSVSDQAAQRALGVWREERIGEDRR
jgi:gentisate 1,2-dioxygenase